MPRYTVELRIEIECEAANSTRASNAVLGAIEYVNFESAYGLNAGEIVSTRVEAWKTSIPIIEAVDVAEPDPVPVVDAPDDDDLPF